MNPQNKYSQLIQAIFEKHYTQGDSEVIFERADIIEAAEKIGIKVPKNLGDVVYSFRYRTPLPENIRAIAPEGFYWVIRPAGHARYKFVLISGKPITPNERLAETKVPDATPGIISKYALTDEQALLARVRYNRLIDIFTGLTCYSLQSHLRTTVDKMGQVETDELYAGLDKRGAQYVIPVQAKGRNDQIGIVQIEQDLAMCRSKFPALICRPIAVKFMDGDLISMFEFEENEKGISVASEKHYLLVAPESITPEDLEKYSRRQSD